MGLATSGVTGWYEPNRHSWLPPGIIGWSRHFVPRRTGVTGYDRLPPGTACVAGV